jgi:antitoxin (DNA-binding transcriptional repressor) of toxin-antitoxin stability system
LTDYASEIMDKMKEDGSGYVITRDGTPAAIVVPIEQSPAERSLQNPNHVWNEIRQIGEQISCGTKFDQTVTEVLFEMRR